MLGEAETAFDGHGGVRLYRLWVLGLLAMTLGGCVGYERAPLARAPRLVPTAAVLTGGSTRVVDIATLDRLVLRNNPDLVAARARLGVGEAQILQAGVLPNPQFTGSYPFYIAGPGGSDGFGLGLAQDIRSIILRPTKREVATNAAAAVHASLLWQEYQTIGKARLLYVDIVMGEQAAKNIARNRKLLKARFESTNASINQGNAPLSTLSPDLVASSDIAKAADDLDRVQLGRRHQLAALLGLAPDAPLKLAADLKVPSLAAPRVRHDLASIADQRPDLIALQYGYRSQDARLRQAVLSQFPNLVVSLFGGRDTNAIYSVTPQASIELPIFDRNEGNIAIERATRIELQREFDARVTAATGEVGALLSEQALLQKQLAALEPRLREARLIADKTEAAFKEGNFDERAYVDIELAVLTQEQQKIGLRQALLEGQVALATLTGAGLPSVTIDAEPPPADPIGLLRAVSR